MENIAALGFEAYTAEASRNEDSKSAANAVSRIKKDLPLST